MRRTANTLAVAAVLLADPDGRHYGYDLSRRAHVRSGRLYPMLTRMLNAGWLADGWEDPATIGGRPPRRYYQLTTDGRTQLAALMDGAKR